MSGHIIKGRNVPKINTKDLKKMETQETQVNGTQAGAELNVPASDGSGNGSAVTNLKDIVGPIFGTEFKTDEDALKSIESAKNLSGKVGQLEAELTRLRTGANMSNEIEQKVQSLEASIKTNQFFNENPAYNTPEAKKLISAMGSDPSQVVESEAFKLAFGAIQAQSEIEKSKSVLMSNPRLGQATDKISTARELLSQNTPAATQEARANAVGAVLEAFEMK